VPPGEGDVLELGSGPGFLARYIPGLITSDVLPVPGVDKVVDARRLDFAAGSLRGIVMTNVLHHIPDVGRFFSEAARCVRPGGVLAMVEPWLTPWSRLIYRRLHHEPFEPDAADWSFPGAGPLSDANGALPWIVFERDRNRFERDFPSWRVRSIRPCMPFRYVLSGGVSLRSLMPGFMHGAWRACERCLQPWMRFWGMFAVIVVERTE
jgi:SAM-dependent methyltransferase